MTSTKLKPFDLTAALAGAPVVTRDGRKVLQIAHFPKVSLSERIVAHIDSNYCIQIFYDDGQFIRGKESKFDLFMAPVKRTVWVNMYRHDCGEIYSGAVGNTKEEALRFSSVENHIGTYPLEIDE